jgi:hypothetical protein
LDVPVVERRESLAKLVARYDVEGVLVVSPDRTAYHEPANGLEYFFHPSMAKVRLHNCAKGDEDPMLRAMELQEGESVLDCTLGRATDAAICAWKVGPNGRVLGLEKSRILAELTIDGLAHYEDSSRKLTELLRRVVAVCADYSEFLPTCSAGSFDIVYFDPIFHDPLEKSQAMAPLRALADCSPLSPAAVDEARRVARRFVVIKQRKKTPLWEELGIIRLVSSPGGNVEYGVIPALQPLA